MDEKKVKNLNNFHSEREEYREKFHQMIKEAKIEQLTNQKYKTNTLKMTSEDIKKYEELREKAKNLIAKARESHFHDKSAKDKETNRIGEHTLSNIDASLYLPALNTEKKFKSYRVKKVKDLPCLKKKLDSRLHDKWKIDESEFERFELTNQRSKSKSKSQKYSYENYELQDLQLELEKINKEAYNLEIALRHAIDNGGDKDLQEYYLKKWYESINKRNAAVRREMQLNLIETEKILNNRHEAVKSELQTLDAIEESQKTDAQKSRQKALEDELVEIVNKRSEILVRLDLEEQAIKDDVHEIGNSEQNDITSINEDYDQPNCSLM